MTVMHVDINQRPPLVEDRQMSKTDNGDQLWTRLHEKPSQLESSVVPAYTSQHSTTKPTNKKQSKPLILKGDKNQPRGKRKSRWKLKFHHQALPPEYLKHYKQQERKRLKETKKCFVKPKVKKTLKMKKGEETEKETVKSRLNVDVDIEQRRLMDEMQDIKVRESDCSVEGRVRCKPSEELLDTHEKNHALLANILSKKVETNKNDKRKIEKQPGIPSSGKIRNYSDLPYMGEITLDGIKPRRGRKPKKADICHLIYKNYGQVFPGGPPAEPSSRVVSKKPSEAERPIESPLPSVSGMLNHTEIQHRIINSLLERRLTHKGVSEEQPLNLCMKDLSSLKIKLSRKHGNIYESNQIKSDICDSESKKSDSEPEEGSSEDEEEEDDERLAPFNLVSAELGESSDEEVGYLNENVTLTRINKNNKLNGPLTENLAAPPPLMFWPPGNNLLLNPMLQSQLMYYQKMSQDMKDQSQEPPTEIKVEKKKKVSKPALKRPAPSTTTNCQALAKRKRSAIFIPPVPAENTSNPTTEVSICKFKFTGGAKPSLQEKKMLSVDAGGNFRYYSGTGDKSMRGYEYYPRESLQHCQDTGSNTPAGVFLAASAMGSGEKMPEDIAHSAFFDTSVPLDQLAKDKKKKNELKFDNYQNLRECLSKVEQNSPDAVALPDSEDTSYLTDKEEFDLQSIYEKVLKEESANLSKKCRKSKKSLVRERLEQTFKEKGFLIQTQQLESAEGATYCKFRQLRKFTRYLFRSWKDYLPNNVQNLNGEAAVDNDMSSASASPQAQDSSL